MVVHEHRRPGFSGLEMGAGRPRRGGRGAGSPGPDWFRVTWDQIDKNDPDYVWRIRKTWRGEIHEMWSPGTLGRPGI